MKLDNLKIGGRKIEDLAPLGMDAEKELRIIIAWLIVAVLYSLPVILRYRNLYSQLYWSTGTYVETLIPGKHMAPMNEVLGTHLLGFVFLVFYMTGMAVFHYTYHRQGSKSIYLMKRLPDKWELHRRCLALPLLGIAAAIITGVIVFFIYLAVYLLVTPDQCIMDGYLQGLWRITL